MRTFFLVLALALAASMQAKEALIEGGRSKDGRFEIRIVQDTNRDERGPSDYVFAIYNTHTNKRLVRLDDVGGLLSYDDARQSSRALWNDSSSFVVVTDSGTRHSTEIYVFNVSDSSAQRIQLPDYLQNALGQVGATEAGIVCGSMLERWDGNRLHLTLTFDVWRSPNEPRVIYTCQVTLAFESTNAARLIEVTKPKAEDTQQTWPPSIAEVQSVRLEVEQPLHANELQIRVRDYSAVAHRRTEVTCWIYYVSEHGKESKLADFVLKRKSDELYSGTYSTGKDFVHGTVAKVVYKSDSLSQPLSTWCTFAFH